MNNLFNIFISRMCYRGIFMFLSRNQTIIRKPKPFLARGWSLWILPTHSDT